MTFSFLAPLLLALAIAAPAGARAAAPDSVKATYGVKMSGLDVAVMTDRFNVSKGHYEAVSETAPVGLFKLVQPKAARVVSRGLVTKQGLKPEHFEGSRGADDPRRVTADFHWQAGNLVLNHDGEKKTVELPPGAQDRLSIMYQLPRIQYDGKKEIEFWMTNGRKIDHYRYSVTPGVEIDTPLGRMTTVHLVKEREPGDPETEIWVAPAHGYLPVKVLIVENGTRYEQVVTELEIQS